MSAVDSATCLACGKPGLDLGEAAHPACVALELADDLAHVVAGELTVMQSGAPPDGLRLLAAYRNARKGS